MKQHLNDPIIKNTKPNDKTQKLSDGGGLFLYVEPNGSKRWRYRFQFEGKEQMLSLGLYPDVSLKTARTERDTLKTQINEHQLAHRVPDALGTAYNRIKYLDDRKIMMQTWGDSLDELKASAAVIKMWA